MSDEPTIQPTGDHADLAQMDGVTGFAQMGDGQPITEVAPDAIFQVAARAKKLGYRILSCLSGYHTKTEGSGVFYCFVKPADTPCLLYTSPSPRDLSTSRMPSSA